MTFSGPSRLATLSLAMFAASSQAADSSTCATCHRAIYNSYRKTAMAASSGIAGRASPPESFANSIFTSSGFRYRATQNGGRYRMQFEKASGATLRGEKALAYFVGSGTVARSYLIATDGFLYEAPVTYYSAAARSSFC